LIKNSVAASPFDNLTVNKIKIAILKYYTKRGDIFSLKRLITFKIFILLVFSWT